MRATAPAGRRLPGRAGLPARGLTACATTRALRGPALPQVEGVALHVSGCAKGCARPAPTAVTLIATEGGYDLVLAGRAGDAPARRRLSSAEAAALLATDGEQIFAGMRARA